MDKPLRVIDLLHKAFHLTLTISEWRLVMPGDTKVPALQEQLDKVQKIVNRIPLVMFAIGIIGGISLGVFTFLAQFFGQFWSLLGFGILGACVGLCSFYVRNAKDEFRKLLEQLNG